MGIEKYISLLKGFSHPNKKIIDHLKNAKIIAEEIKNWHEIEIDTDNIILTHDIAKNNPKFQQHLKNPKFRFNHSEPSSFFTFFETESFLDAEIVRRHHSTFENYDNSKSFWEGLDIDDIKKQTNESLPEYPIEEEKLEEILNSFILEKGNKDLWYEMRLKASIFITSDRMEATGISKMNFSLFKSVSKLSEIRFPENAINIWRAKNQEIILKKMKSTSSGKIYRLSLPTGSGKTLLSLKIAEKIKPKTLIYVLPFISICDEIYEFTSRYFSDVQEDHYLSEKEDTSIFRYWSSSIIITTLCHFWDVLFSPKLTDTMNFHRFKDALVIIDEVQALEKGYFESLSNALKLLSEKMNTAFLLMTATLPNFLPGKNIGINTAFPIERHEFLYAGKKNIDEIPEIIPRDGSGLIVLNTKESALSIYKMLEKKKKSGLYFLSRWVTPLGRKKTIKKIKELEKQGKKRILVSTQVIEAGIDLDFDWVIRDLGPFESIIQAAGRCNRHGKKEKGKIIIADICDSDGNSYSEKVYQKIVINSTRGVLKEKFSEKESQRLLEKYFKELKEKISQSGPWDYIEEGFWGEKNSLIKNYFEKNIAIIEESNEIRELTEEFISLEKSYTNLDKRKKLLKKIRNHSIEISDENIQRWIQKTSGYIMDDEEKEIESISESIFLITKKGIGKIYHPKKGFIPPD